MSSPFIIPPSIVRGDKKDWQHDADLQQFYQRNTLPQVLLWDIDSVSGDGNFPGLIRIPSIPGIVSGARVTAWTAGSGTFRVNIQYSDSVGAAHGIWAAAGDQLLTVAGSVLPVYAPATNRIIADPADTIEVYRFWPSINSFAGTAWGGVTIELFLFPVSQNY